MHCMKCGREIEEQQVFCPDCLAQMSQNPVRPGTVVRLPQRQTVTLSKKRFFRRKRELPPEEQLIHQRIIIRRLALILAVAILLLIAAGFLLVWIFKLKNIVDIPDLGLISTAAAHWQCFT